MKTTNSSKLSTNLKLTNCPTPTNRSKLVNMREKKDRLKQVETYQQAESDKYPKTGKQTRIWTAQNWRTTQKDKSPKTGKFVKTDKRPKLSDCQKMTNSPEPRAAQKWHSLEFMSSTKITNHGTVPNWRTGQNWKTSKITKQPKTGKNPKESNRQETGKQDDIEKWSQTDDSKVTKQRSCSRCTYPTSKSTKHYQINLKPRKWSKTDK